MATKAQMSELAQLSALNSYIGIKNKNTYLSNSNPAIVSKISTRDADRGKTNIVIGTGTSQANKITSNGSLPYGATIPATIATKSTAFIDAKPSS